MNKTIRNAEKNRESDLIEMQIEEEKKGGKTGGKIEKICIQDQHTHNLEQTLKKKKSNEQNKYKVIIR